MSIIKNEISILESDMIIRKADCQDYRAIWRISREDLGYECCSELVAQRLSHLDGKREVVFVAEINNNIIGYIHAETYNVLYYESMVNILGLAVASEYRKNGVGRALLSEAEIWAKGLNIKIIRLNSGATRKEAHAFYRAMGYDNQKEQIRFIKNLD